MRENNRSDRQTFSCTSASLHFIYSFLPRLNDPSPGVCSLLTDDAKSRIEATLGPETKFGAGLPPLRVGVAPYLRLCPDTIWTQFPNRNAWVDQEQVNVSAVVRQFSAGATCTLSVDAAPSASHFFSKDILRFLKLGEPHPNGEASTASLRYEEGGHSGTLYTAFASYVRRYIGCLPKVSWTEAEPLTKAEQGTEPFYDLIDPVAPEPQTPWVVTVAEVTGEIADAFCSPGTIALDPAESKVLSTRPYQPDVAEIVFRSIAEDLELEPAYVRAPNGRGVPGLFSVNVDARLFVCTSRRSILCLCPNKDKHPASYFIPTLLDICEVIRAHWHALVITNKMMDSALRDFAALRGSAMERRQRLKSIRVQLANSLEDPSMYIVAGDALSKIMDDLTGIFRLEELRAALLRKMDLIDNIYTDAQDLFWLEKKGQMGGE